MNLSLSFLISVNILRPTLPIDWQECLAFNCRAISGSSWIWNSSKPQASRSFRDYENPESVRNTDPTDRVKPQQTIYPVSRVLKSNLFRFILVFLFQVWKIDVNKEKSADNWKFMEKNQI